MLDDLLTDLEDSSNVGFKGTIVGIDLGTTNSVISAVVDGQPKVLADEKGNELHPSIVAWLPDGRRVAGAEARVRKVIDPQNTVYSIKRVIGKPFHNEGVQRAIEGFPFNVVEGDREEIFIETRDGLLPVPQVSAYVLAHLKNIAERSLGRTVTHCVITVPAHFSDAQRAATRRAGELAGMEVMRILNEPTAAALAYGYNLALNKRMAIFDLGGGTFDVTVLSVRKNLSEVLATGGDPFLGGDDVDREVYDWLAKAFLKKHRIDASKDPVARARLLLVAERIKHSLSEEQEVAGSLAEVTKGVDGGSIGLDFKLSRESLEKLIAELVDKAMATTDRVLEEAGLSATLLDGVILVGGSTHIPMVRELVEKRFGGKALSTMDPMKVVAIGAALQGEALTNPNAAETTLLDVASHSLRVATAGGFTKVLVKKNTTIPAEGDATFFTAKDGQTSVVLQIAEGEEERFADNSPLGELRLEGLPEGRRGDVAVRVAFIVNSDGMLEVSARDTKGTAAAHASLSLLGLQQKR